MGDDSGISNLGYYSQGLMASRSAGRASLTGQSSHELVVMMGSVQLLVARLAQPVPEFPRRQKPASFTIDQVLATIHAGIGSR